MKPTRLMVDNFLGINSVAVNLTTPITLFCGLNGSGKSSIRDAVKMAMTGEAERVSLKKDYDKLVRDGEKAGGALLMVGDDGAYGFNVPAGSREVTDGLPVGTSVEVALNGQRVASMTPDERRSFLFKVAGCKASAEEVKARLLKRDCDSAMVEAVLPMLRSGFPAAHEFAAEKAKDAKRDWRAQTGENYGSAKAEGWKAIMPVRPEISATPEDVAALDEQIALLNQEIGAASAALRAAAEAQDKWGSLKIKAEKVEWIAGNLTDARDRLAEYERASGTRRVGLVHDLALHVFMYTAAGSEVEDEANALMKRYEEEFGSLPNPEPRSVDADAKASLPEYERGLEVMKNAVKNLERDLADAQAAKAAYDAIDVPAASTVTPGDLDAMQARLAKLKDDRMQKQGELLADQQHLKAVQAAQAKTEAAAAAHQAVCAWLQIADALAPSGIPGELLAEALKPVLTALQIAAADTHWRPVSIDSAMQITYGGREYALLSESEQWRVDAMIAYAIAKLSGLKLLMLDRVDVLDLGSRGVLLDWLLQLADDGEIECALLFATLKAKPTGLSKEIGVHWIEKGAVVEEAMKEAA